MPQRSLGSLRLGGRHADRASRIHRDLVKVAMSPNVRFASGSVATWPASSVWDLILDQRVTYLVNLRQAKREWLPRAHLTKLRYEASASISFGDNVLAMRGIGSAAA
jgi:hypothetical protein